MSDSAGLSHHPAPHADRLSSGRAAFILCGGPLAWFAQFLIGVSLTDWACFPRDERLWAPLDGYAWTRLAAAGVITLCAAIALCAGLAAQQILRRVAHEEEGDHEDLAEIGHGRTRFVALWGVVLGYGSTVAAVLTLVAFIMVPRCAG